MSLFLELHSLDLFLKIFCEFFFLIQENINDMREVGAISGGVSLRDYV